MTGDQNDILARLKAVIPAGWFPDASPILDGVLTGCAATLAWSYSLLDWLRSQTRILTASGVWLDVIAADFFGSFLRRRSTELDTPFRARIIRELFREKATRSGLVKALADLTGRTPAIFEPDNPADTGGLGTGGVGYCVAGGWGTLALPFQFFVTALRPSGGGIANVAGFGNIGLSLTAMPGGYGQGAFMYGSADMIASPISDAEILATINDVKPVATVAWTNIEDALSLPAAPGPITGLVGS